MLSEGFWYGGFSVVIPEDFFGPGVFFFFSLRGRLRSTMRTCGLGFRYCLLYTSLLENLNFFLMNYHRLIANGYRKKVLDDEIKLIQLELDKIKEVLR